MAKANVHIGVLVISRAMLTQNYCSRSKVFTFNVATRFSPPFLHSQNQGHPSKAKTHIHSTLLTKTLLFSLKGLQLSKSSPVVNRHCWSANFQLPYLQVFFWFWSMNVHGLFWNKDKTQDHEILRHLTIDDAMVHSQNSIIVRCFMFFLGFVICRASSVDQYERSY